MSENCVVILAGGEGTRMKSQKPKVMAEILFKPMIDRVIDAAKGAGKVGRTGADRQSHDDRFCVETFFNIVDDRVKIRALSIHLIDERDSRNVIFIRLSPDRFALGFDSLARAENDDAAVKNAERTLDLGGKIDVAGRVDEIKREIVPFEGNASGVDRNSPFALFRIIVGDRRSRVYHSNLVHKLGIEEHLFRNRRFTGVNVRDNANIAKVLFRVRRL